MTVPSFYVFLDLFTVCALALSIHDVGVYLVSQVAVQLELAHKDDQRQQHQNGRHAKGDKADGRLGGVVNVRSDDLLVVVHQTQTAKQNDGLNGVGHLLQKAFHREGDAFVALAVLVFAVVHNICQEDGLCHKHGTDAHGGDNVTDVQRNGKLQYRAEDIHQYVAKDGHTQRDDVDGALGKFLRQQRNDQQTYGRANGADGREHGLCRGFFQHIGKVVHGGAAGQVPAGVGEHGEDHKDDQLIVMRHHLEHFLKTEFLFICLVDDMTLFGAQHADQGEAYQRHGTDQCPARKAGGAVPLVGGDTVRQLGQDQRGQNGNQSLSDTAKGARYGGYQVPILRVRSERRHHRPVGNICHGVGHAPQNVHKGNIHIEPSTAHAEAGEQ